MDAPKKLDLRDRRILLELDFNARDSDADIAKRVGLSKESASYRIRRLQSSGVIGYFHTILDTTQLGLHYFRIFARLQGISAKDEEGFRDYLVGNRDVLWMASTYGNWKYNVLVASKSAHDFMRFWHALDDRFGAFIEDKRISEMTRMTHFRRDYLVPGAVRAKPLVWGKYGDAECDDIDRKILTALSKDARAPLTEIGRRIGVSYKTVGNRIAELERNGTILGYRATLDLNAIGYRYYKVHMDLQRETGAKVAALSSFLAASPNAFMFDEAVGGYDMELEMQARDDDSVLSLIDAAKARFPELIRNYEVLRYLKEYKVDYLPGSMRA